MKTLSLLYLTAAVTVACNTGPGPLGTGVDDPSTADGQPGGDDGSGLGAPGHDPGSDPGPTTDPALAARHVDYNEALRTASLKLAGRLPTLERIQKVHDATDPKAAYEAELDAMLAAPAFNANMVKFWSNTMRMGGDGLDSAPVFAAKLMAEGSPITQLFTAPSGNCPTFDEASGTFAEGDCQSGAPVEAGVLTDPAVMKQFYGNMAFRRVRWIQETFYCSKMPAEVADAPTQIDGKDYTSPWDFQSIASAPINFQDTQSVVCANCHTTLNHVAPLFANFDADGLYQPTISVMTPTAPDPVQTELGHWLQPGETTAWRHGEPVADLAALGQALAQDPGVGECLVARMWNFALSKEDIVADLATVPFGVVEDQIDTFDGNGNDLKAVLRDIMTSEDFVSF